MSEKNYGIFHVEVDEEGFMTRFEQWNKDIANAIAQNEGIPILTNEHWAIIEFMQKENKENGSPPSIRKMNKNGIVSTKKLYELFPGGPAKKAAKIAGLKKPVGCV